MTTTTITIRCDNYELSSKTTLYRVTYPSGHYMSEPGPYASVVWQASPFRPMASRHDPLDDDVVSQEVCVHHSDTLPGGPTGGTVTEASPKRLIGMLTSREHNGDIPDELNGLVIEC